MPTITYLHEPTDSVYIIDYSNDLKAETVVKGTIYRVDAVVRNKGGLGTAAIEQVPSSADIATSQATLDAMTPTLDAAKLDRDAKQSVLNVATDSLELEEAAYDPVSISYQNAVDALTTANAALALDPANTTLIADVNNAQGVVDALQPNMDAAQTALDAAQADVTVAASEFGIAENLVDTMQADYDAIATTTVITTVGVPAEPATDPEMVLKYVIRTEYNESVVIEDESLIFTDKAVAFQVLSDRTA